MQKKRNNNIANFLSVNSKDKMLVGLHHYTLNVKQLTVRFKHTWFHA